MNSDGLAAEKNGPLSIISVHSIVCKLKEIRSNVKVSLPEHIHEHILTWIEEFNVHRTLQVKSIFM